VSAGLTACGVSTEGAEVFAEFIRTVVVAEVDPDGFLKAI
jgi:hypothetical protein